MTVPTQSLGRIPSHQKTIAIAEKSGLRFGHGMLFEIEARRCSLNRVRSVLSKYAIRHYYRSHAHRSVDGIPLFRQRPNPCADICLNTISQLTSTFTRALKCRCWRPKCRRTSVENTRCIKGRLVPTLPLNYC